MIDKNMIALAEIRNGYTLNKYGNLTLEQNSLIKYDNLCLKLIEENKKYKEVIDKLEKYINDYNVFEVFSFPLMKRWEEEQVKSSIDYEFKTSLIKYLKDILKEVE